MKKVKFPFIVMVLAVLVVCATMMWGVTTSWGDVRIERTNIQSTDGKTISAVIYIPKNATNKTKAPLAINLHGRANSAHVCDSWALEEARRGYVAVSMDINGGGESSVEPQSTQVFNYLKYLWTLPFVQADQTSLIGFSAGNFAAYDMVSSDKSSVKYSEAIVGYNKKTGNPIQTKDNIVSFIDTCSPMAFTYSNITSTNVSVIKAKEDEYNYGIFNYQLKVPYSMETYNSFIEKAWAKEIAASGSTKVQTDTYYGDWSNRTGRVYFVAENTIHQTPDVSSNAIGPLVTSLMKGSTAPNPIDPSNQVWGWAQLFAILCALTAMVLVIAVGKMLVDMPAFAGIKNEIPENRGVHGTEFWVDLAVATILPAVLFIPLTALYMKYLDGSWIQSIFTSTNLSAIVFWLLCTTLISTVIMVCKYAYKHKKFGYQFDISHYALAAEGEKINWKNVGKAFVVAVLTLSIVLVWLNFSETVFGVSYHFWIVANVESVCLERLWKAIPYMVIIFLVLLVSGIGMNTGRRLKDTGNAAKDMRRNMAMNAAIAAFPVLILLLLQYGSCWLSGTGSTLFPYGFTTGQSSMGALNYAWGFPFLMGSMASFNTYFYRKTGNVWLGALIGGMIAGALAFNGQPWIA